MGVLGTETFKSGDDDGTLVTEKTLLQSSFYGEGLKVATQEKMSFGIFKSPLFPAQAVARPSVRV